MPSREVRNILLIMIRALAVACLSLLLLGMQQQLVVHEFDHLRVKLERGHDAVALNPDGSACAQCVLLAAGSGVVPADEVDSALVA